MEGLLWLSFAMIVASGLVWMGNGGVHEYDKEEHRKNARIARYWFIGSIIVFALLAMSSDPSFESPHMKNVKFDQCMTSGIEKSNCYWEVYGKREE